MRSHILSNFIQSNDDKNYNNGEFQQSDMASAKSIFHMIFVYFKAVLNMKIVSFLNFMLFLTQLWQNRHRIAYASNEQRFDTVRSQISET